MSIFFVLSVVYLVLLFLMYKKSDKSICFISSFIYTVGLLFCYNTFIVYLLYLLGIKGSLFIFSIINFLVGTVIGGVILKRGKQLQKYYFDKKKLVIFLVCAIVIFLIGWFRFRGFEAISFESGDSAIHYRHALEFSNELSILDINNSKDEVFGAFVRVMPISYINCGLLINIFSYVKSCTVFFLYNVACLILSAFLFLITVIDTFKYKKKDYVYALILSLFYTLAFPLNSFLMGFCYLGLGIMVINLLYLSVIHFKDNFNKDIIFKIGIVFLIVFSIFYAYYLFVPAIYLALGIYYIYLWRKKKLSLGQMLAYGIMTLIIPFSIGFLYFFVSLFAEKGVGIVATMINLYGYSYNNITPMYLFIGVLPYLLYTFIKKRKYDYLKINLYVVSIYIIIFLILYIFKLADLYYFYKLFFLYWFLLILFLGKKIETIKRIFYYVFAILMVINVFVYMFPENRLSLFLVKTNIYTWNTSVFVDDKLVFDKDEFDLMEKSMEYKDICENNGKFLIMGDILKNIWYYSITDSVPVLGNIDGEVHNIYMNMIPNFRVWEYMSEFDCLIYYYEGKDVDIDENRYNILYENESGLIIKRN